MITAHLSTIREGEAITRCAVSFVVNCPLDTGNLAFELNTQHKGVWSTVSKEVSLSRTGYNFIFFYLDVKPASYMELNVTDMTGIDVIYTSTISALSMVRV